MSWKRKKFFQKHKNGLILQKKISIFEIFAINFRDAVMTKNLANIYFRDPVMTKNFANIYFREFIHNSRNSRKLMILRYTNVFYANTTTWRHVTSPYIVSRLMGEGQVPHFEGSHGVIRFCVKSCLTKF